MSKLYNDFLVYRDQYGLTGLDPHGGSQNGALFTMEYLIHLMHDTETSDEVRQMELERLRKVYESLENFPGVSARKPNDKEFDSMDNTGAIAAFSGLYDNGGYSKRSWEHGSKTRAKGIDQTQDAQDNNKFYKTAWILSGFRAPRFFWNNNTPDLFCLFGWHGRSPAHLAFLKMTAGKFVGPLGFLSVLVGQFLGCFADKGDSDARKLPYVAWQFLKKRSFLWKAAYKLWCYILMKQYANGMKDVYDQYYRDPNHPIHEHAKPYLK